jgi:putative hydrolase of the HAD superfamily
MGDKISAIVFDIGHVLLDLSFDPILRFLAANGCETDGCEIWDVLPFSALQCGEMTAADFVLLVQRKCSVPVVEQEIRAVLNSIFVPVAPMFQLARNLRARYTVALLSNTNEIHWPSIQEQFPLASLADIRIASHEVRCAKPDERIFRIAESRLDLPPDQIVLVDDSVQNIDTAVRLGWHGVLHTSYSSTLLALRGLGVHPSEDVSLSELQ